MNDDLINTTLIAERRRELNMTARTLAKAAAVPQAVLYPHQPKAGAGYNITLGELARIAAVLAVSPADLLRRPNEAPNGPAGGDVAVMLAALMDEAHVTLVHRDDLACALGWPVERVDDAVRQATEHVPTLGLMLHQHPGGGLGLRAQHGLLSSEEQQRLARAQTLRKNLPRDQARTLREVVDGVYDSRWTRMLSRHIPIQALRKRGLIHDTDAGLRLTATAAYSLLLTNEPPSDAADQSDQRPWPSVVNHVGRNTRRASPPAPSPLRPADDSS